MSTYASPVEPSLPDATAVSPDSGNVMVWASDRFVRERIRMALIAGDLPVLPFAEPPEDIETAEFADEPGAVVLASKRADPESLDKLQRLRVALPATGLILVSDRVANGDVRKALDAGVDGVLQSARLDESLAATVRAVLAGQLVVPADSREHVQRAVLTTREKQILGLVVMGLTNNEIATKLFLAESTVKSHLSSAFAKLGVASRNEAVSFILDPVRGRGLGILTIPSERVGV
jgi:DNA-binding NarL/FixJ family response regulator